MIILSGPSGVGKSTIRDRVMAESPFPIRLSVSATTRKPRSGEADGVDYHFLTDEQFRTFRENGDFLECKEVFGRNIWYGTLRSEVESYLDCGGWVMLEIDVDGTLDVLKKYPDALTIFILPESLEVLEARLRKRGTESEEVIQHRLSRAEYEIHRSDFYKYHIINGDLDVAVKNFFDIMRQEENSEV